MFFSNLKKCMVLNLQRPFGTILDFFTNNANQKKIQNSSHEKCNIKMLYWILIYVWHIWPCLQCKFNDVWNVIYITTFYIMHNFTFLGLCYKRSSMVLEGQTFSSFLPPPHLQVISEIVILSTKITIIEQQTTAISSL